MGERERSKTAELWIEHLTAAELRGEDPVTDLRPAVLDPRAMIGIQNLSKYYGPQVLFEKVNLQLQAGSRYGVVGANGSGKSTFLKILMGEETASLGEIGMPKGIRLGMLRQDQFLNDDKRVVDVAMMGDEIVYAALTEQEGLFASDDPDPNRMGELDEVLHAHDGYGLESRAAQILVGLGVRESELKKPLGALSGGYKLRVLLAQALVGRPDALFLDEPTNHLDIVSIRWLEKFLLAFRGCAVIVSHDQRFMNSVATHILDVDYGTVFQYRGNYDDFTSLKDETRDRKEAEVERVERAIAEKKASLERFKAKATKARQANSRLKQLERVEIERLQPTSRRYPNFNFTMARQSGKDVLDVKGLEKSYGPQRVLENVSFTVRRGERIAIIGANGLGKSTLLKICAGHLTADGGQAEWGHETRVGYFAQDHRDVMKAPSQSTLDFLWDFVPEETTNHVRGVLGRMLFSREEVDKEVGHLSGGEAARLVFCQLMVQKPNVLLLDEPTNHLDLESIEALVEALDKYEGTLVFVSHDRWFVEKLATRIVEVRQGGLREFAGSYDAYIAHLGEDHLDTSAPQRPSKVPSKSTSSGKTSAASESPPAPKDNRRVLRTGSTKRTAQPGE